VAATILQVNFSLNVSVAEYRNIAAAVAPAFADLPGLRWKTWLLDEQRNEAGGIYLFESEAALQNFVNGPLAAQVQAHPALKNFTAKRFAVMEDVSAVTHAPVGTAV